MTPVGAEIRRPTLGILAVDVGLRKNVYEGDDGRIHAMACCANTSCVVERALEIGL